ncbi:MAG: glycosyltransferase family 39 protein [Alphaproteobacteria bacterium]|nr:glycosyltransferase family 39 protein [Alphaproteobacteria bacterium]
MQRLADHRLAAAVFALGAVCLYLTAPHHGEFWWSDSPRHALNGVFIKDLIAQMPHDPKAWAMQYYVKYPALTILFYPPLFYVVSAPFYAVLGVSQSTGLVVVMLHYFALALGTYMLARRWTGEIAAIAAGLAVMAVPGMALWGRQIMLEVPSLAFAVWAMVALERFAAAEKPRMLYLCVLLLLCSAYTKLNAAFLFPVVGVVVLSERGKAALSDKHVWFAAALAVIGLIPLALLTLKFGSANVQSVMSVPDAAASRTTLAGWTWYLRQMPGLVGWPLLALGFAAPLLGLLGTLKTGVSRAGIVLLVSWFVVGYLALSFIDLKEARHALLILPPLLIAAATVLPALLPERRLGELLLAAVVVGTGVYTWMYAPVPRIDGYRQAAEWIAAHAPKDAVVVFSGKRDGAYVFNMRSIEGRRDITTLRSDKLLLTVAVRRQLGVKQKQMSESEMADMLDRYGVSYVVAQDDFWIDLPVMERFQNVLRSRHFAEVARIPVTSNIPVPDRVLHIYRNLGPLNPHPGSLVLDLAIIGQKVSGSVGK